MGFLALLIGVAATYRLRATPLATTAAVFTAVQAAAWLVLIVRARQQKAPSRPWTALHHVCAAMSGFFLFVSFALGSAR